MYNEELIYNYEFYWSKSDLHENYFSLNCPFGSATLYYDYDDNIWKAFVYTAHSTIANPILFLKNSIRDMKTNIENLLIERKLNE